MQLLVFERFYIIEEFVTRPFATSNYIAILETFWLVFHYWNIARYFVHLVGMRKVWERWIPEHDSWRPVFPEVTYALWNYMYELVKGFHLCHSKTQLKKLQVCFRCGVTSNQLEWNTIRPLLQQLFYCQSVYTSPFKLVLLKIFRKCYWRIPVSRHKLCEASRETHQCLGTHWFCVSLVLNKKTPHQNICNISGIWNSVAQEMLFLHFNVSISLS